MAEEVDNRVENETIDVTITVKGALLAEGCSVTSQPDYHLTLLDFYTLKNPKRKLIRYRNSSFIFSWSRATFCKHF